MATQRKRKTDGLASLNLRHKFMSRPEDMEDTGEQESEGIEKADDRKLKSRIKKTSSKNRPSASEGVVMSEARRRRLAKMATAVAKLNLWARDEAMTIEEGCYRTMFRDDNNNDPDEACAALPPDAEAIANKQALSLKLLTDRYTRRMSALKDLYGSRGHGNSVLVFGNGESNQMGLEVMDLNKFSEVTRPRQLKQLYMMNVIQVACGALHNAAVADDGRLLTWGQNDEGSLGRITKGEGEFSEQFPVPVSFEGVRGLSSDGQGTFISRASAGDIQTLCLTTEGQVFAFGAYKDIEGKKWRDMSVDDTFTGQEDSKVIMDQLFNSYHSTPVLVRGFDEPVVDIVCGCSFNVAKLPGCRVLTWGMGENGELGRGKHQTNEKVPFINEKNEEDEKVNYFTSTIVQELLTPKPPLFADGLHSRKIVEVACGNYHFLCTTYCAQDGYGTRTWSTGLNQYGQLGHGDSMSRYELTRIEALDTSNIHLLAAGEHHSLVTDGDGQMLSFGRGDNGQLGISEKIPSAGFSSALPRPVLPLWLANGEDASTEGGGNNEDHLKIEHIACGQTHNFAVTRGGQLYTWGYKVCSQTGHGKDVDGLFDDDDCVTRPTRVEQFVDDKVRYGATSASSSANELHGYGVRVHQAAGGAQHSAIIAKFLRDPQGGDEGGPGGNKRQKVTATRRG